MTDPLPHAWRFDAIGTVWRIDTPDELTAEARAAVSVRIDRFDRDWSRFRKDSLVSRIAGTSGGGRYALPDDAPALLGWYRRLYEATGGRVSPLVGRTLETLGYDSAYRLTPASAASRAPVPAWSDAVAWDGTHLDVAQPVVLDVGAAGKGYLVDIVGDLLAELGAGTSIVDAGGDLRVRGDVSLRVGLEHPRDPSKVIGVVELRDGSLCASASNRRAWGDGLHHVLDAVTGVPTTTVIATWVLAPDALHADGLATALFFDADPDLYRHPGVAWARMSSRGQVQHSADFPGELFT